MLIISKVNLFQSRTIRWLASKVSPSSARHYLRSVVAWQGEYISVHCQGYHSMTSRHLVTFTKSDDKTEWRHSFQRKLRAIVCNSLITISFNIANVVSDDFARSPYSGNIFMSFGSTLSKLVNTCSVVASIWVIIHSWLLFKVTQCLDLAKKNHSCHQLPLNRWSKVEPTIREHINGYCTNIRIHIRCCLFRSVHQFRHYYDNQHLLVWIRLFRVVQLDLWFFVTPRNLWSNED